MTRTAGYLLLTAPTAPPIKGDVPIACEWRTGDAW
jgi:hypothetical protein